MSPELEAVLAAIPPELRADPEALRDWLYAHAFARGLAPAVGEPSWSERELTRRLSAANTSRDRWSSGWRIERVEPSGAIVASKEGRRHTAPPGEYALTFSESLVPRAGMAVMLFLPRESLTLQQGVYYAFGETLPDGDARAIRYYLHALEDALPELYARLTEWMNRWEIAFTLKTMLAMHERDRRDATLLYVSRKDAARTAEALLRALPAAMFRDGVPLFTHEIARGIGMAQSPGNGESFGMHRCRLVAEGIVDGDVRRRFAEEGVDLDRPYLGATEAPLILTADNVAGWLRSKGHELEDGFEVIDRSSRNRNFAVGGFFVKQLRVDDPESLRMMRREAAVYGWAPPELVPRFFGFDRRARVLVFERLEDGGDRHSEAFAAAAARSLALLRAQTLPPLALREPPGILTAHRGGPLVRWLGAGQRELIAQVAAHPVLSNALDELAVQWRAEAPIHGDVKWENALWSGEGEVKWIDWELAGAGDPLWDAGCFVQAYLSRSLEVPRAFLVFYDEGERPRILRYAAARMIQTALEVMHGEAHPTPRALGLVEGAAEGLG